MLRILALGTAAALCFSSTFVLNRVMSVAGGHWVWTASLRYFWMLCLLVTGLAVLGRAGLLTRVLDLYRRHWKFWTIAGCVGFGLFYALLSFSASYAPGWVVAATWQVTILATLPVLALFGRKVGRRAVLLTSIIFIGVVLVNVEQAGHVPIGQVLLGAVPVLVAALAYPLGNQLLWESQVGRGRLIPRIDDPIMNHSVARVLLLTLGSMPLWLALIAFVQPPAPTVGQVSHTALVAVLSGIIATTLFLHARHKARNPAELAAADSTQSMEVMFSLAGEAALLGGVLPGALGGVGIALAVLGLVLYLRSGE